VLLAMVHAVASAQRGQIRGDWHFSADSLQAHMKERPHSSHRCVCVVRVRILGSAINRSAELRAEFDNSHRSPVCAEEVRSGMSQMRIRESESR